MMKKHYLLLIMAATLMMCGCLKDEKFVTKTTYSGYVKDNDNVPMTNVHVYIGDYSSYNDSEHILISTFTDASGHFSITLDCINAPNNSRMYLFVSNKYNKYPLILGQETYDYGTIIL